MRMRRLGVTLASLLALLALLSAPAGALGRDDQAQFTARLRGYAEVPATASTATGQLQLALSEDGQSLSYELTYAGLSGPALFAHIHFGQRRVNGGVVAFLCGGGGKPACPGTGGTVRGTIAASDIVGPAAQGIAPGEFAKVLRALRHGVIYANVHSPAFPAGEIRGQVLQPSESEDPGGDD
jgi:hypothetical protein